MFTNFENMYQTAKSRVFFHFDNVRITLRNRVYLKKHIESIFRAERMKLGRLDYVFCSDKKILPLNRQFFSHNYSTDTISFNLSDNQVVIIGEIYISIDSVKKNAKIYNEPVSRELNRVMIHGALHLCGYEDSTKSEKVTIQKKEDYYLSKLKS